MRPVDASDASFRITRAGSIFVAFIIARHVGALSGASAENQAQLSALCARGRFVLCPNVTAIMTFDTMCVSFDACITHLPFVIRRIKDCLIFPYMMHYRGGAFATNENVYVRRDGKQVVVVAKQQSQYVVLPAEKH